MTEDLYEVAVREWLARQVRPTHASITRDDIRNPRFGYGGGFSGTEVTPAEEDYAVIYYECRRPDGRGGEKWTKFYRAIDGVGVVEIVHQCLVTHHELLMEQARKEIQDVTRNVA